MNRTRAEHALAAVVHEIRDEWDEHGVTAILRKLSDKPLADVSAAALYCAAYRTDQRTPACIALPGEHWQALERMTGKEPEQRPAYLAGAHCPEHGQSLPCFACDAIRRGPQHPLRAWRELAAEGGGDDA